MEKAITLDMNKGSNISADVYLLNCLVSGQTAQKYLNYGLLKYSDTLEYTSLIKTGSGFMLGGLLCEVSGSVPWPLRLIHFHLVGSLQSTAHEVKRWRKEHTRIDTEPEEAG